MTDAPLTVVAASDALGVAISPDVFDKTYWVPLYLARSDMALGKD